MVSTSEFLKMIEESNKWKHNINYRKSPLTYDITDDCGGIYTCEPYKSILLDIWRFSTPEASEKSAASIKKMFLRYLDEEDFVGADLALKYLRAGSSRSGVPPSSRERFTKVYNELSIHSGYLSLREKFKEEKENAKG